jgi:radical SAM superfamily enzyme YgiQ (UPF0313 family)
MKRKILFINPNFRYFPGWLENVVNYRQLPLGLGYIAAYLREHAEAEIQICDASMYDLNEEAVLEQIVDFKPDIIGISVHTLTVGFSRRVALAAKQLFPEAVIVFGGPHASALPFENLDVADINVSGEGEESFAEIANNLFKGQSLEGVKGIAFKKNGGYCKTEERGLIENLDKLPFPARDLFFKHKYRHNYPYRLKNRFYAAVITARGCNFRCNFCMNEFLWKGKVRNRSLGNVFAEMEDLIKIYNISLLRIGDDNFTADEARVREFCRGKNKYFSGLKWFCHARADTLNRDLAREMKAAGCIEVQVGVESGDDTVLSNCNKRQNTNDIFRAFRILKDERINQWAPFIIGNEGDSKETVEKTIDFAKKIDPTYSSFLFLSPLPGTKTFESLYNKGYLKTLDWSKYNFHAEPVFETDSLSKDMLLRLRIRAYRKFYLRPKAVLRYLYAGVASGEWRALILNSLLLFKFIFGLIEKEKNES